MSNSRSPSRLVKLGLLLLVPLAVVAGDAFFVFISARVAASNAAKERAKVQEWTQRHTAAGEFCATTRKTELSQPYRNAVIPKPSGVTCVAVCTTHPQLAGLSCQGAVSIRLVPNAASVAAEKRQLRCDAGLEGGDEIQSNGRVGAADWINYCCCGAEG